MAFPSRSVLLVFLLGLILFTIEAQAFGAGSKLLGLPTTPESTDPGRYRVHIQSRGQELAPW